MASSPIDQAPGGTINPRLTADGLDCVVEHGGSVSEHLGRNDRGGDVNTFNISDNRGNLSIGGQNYSQTTHTGIDTTELLKFAGAVRQLLPTLGLNDEDAAVLDQQAEELQAAASQPEPELGTLRRL